MNPIRQNLENQTIEARWKLNLTLCKTCGKGESAGGHDPVTGIAADGHKFVPDLSNTYGDRFVANRHKAGSY